MTSRWCFVLYSTVEMISFVLRASCAASAEAMSDTGNMRFFMSSSPMSASVAARFAGGAAALTSTCSWTSSRYLTLPDLAAAPFSLLTLDQREFFCPSDAPAALRRSASLVVDVATSCSSCLADAAMVEVPAMGTPPTIGTARDSGPEAAISAANSGDLRLVPRNKRAPS